MKLRWTNKGSPLSDEDKGISIKTLLTVMAILVTVLLSSFQSVMAYGALTERVDNIENRDATRDATLGRIEGKLNEVDKSVAGIEINLQVMKEDIYEIKEMIV